MNYYLSAPMLEKDVPAASLESIITLHGTYDDFNAKLQAVCNKPEFKEVFEASLREDELEWLSQFNVTLYSGQEQQKLVTGVELQFQPSEVSAVATKTHGIPYIAIDVDMLLINPNNWSAEQQHGYMAHVLVHECTHLQQMIRGDLDVTTTGMVWKGVEYPHSHLTSMVADTRSLFTDPEEFQFNLVIQQIELPWELEAYGRALEIVDLDTAYPDPKWNSLMRKIQTDFRSLYMDKGKDENVH